LPAVAKIGSINIADAILNGKQCPGEVPVLMWYDSMSLGIGSCCKMV